MSIFDPNIHLPIEELYEQCKEIVEWIIPMNMMHYNGSCETMRHDIERMLLERGLITNAFWIGRGDVNKISKVVVEYGEYIRRIPTYKVKFYYVKEFTSDLWHNEPVIESTSYFTQFTVGINGIINEHIQ